MKATQQRLAKLEATRQTQEDFIMVSRVLVSVGQCDNPTFHSAFVRHDGKVYKSLPNETKQAFIARLPKCTRLRVERD